MAASPNAAALSATSRSETRNKNVAKRKNKPPNTDFVDDAVVGTAAALTIGAVLSAPFVGFWPAIAVAGGIMSAAVVLRALTDDDDDKPSGRKPRRRL